MNDKRAVKEDEIDLINIIFELWEGRKTIILSTIFCASIGIATALLTTSTYTAQVIFIPKGKNNLTGSSLGGFASLAGISLNDFGGTNNDIPPGLYPMISESNPFIEILLNSKIFQNNDSVTFKEYLKRKSSQTNPFKNYIINIPSSIFNYLFQRTNLNSSNSKSKSIKTLSLEDEKLYKAARELISVSVDKKQGFVTISVEEENPIIAAKMANEAQAILEKRIIDYKIKNATEIFNFTEKLYSSKREIFENLQDKLANFKDRHQNISSGIFQNKLNRLESELSIARTVTEELAKQVEKARIQISENTPIFTIIEPVFVPNNRTKPRRTLIVICFSSFGLLFGMIFNPLRKILMKIKSQIRSKQEF